MKSVPALPAVAVLIIAALCGLITGPSHAKIVGGTDLSKFFFGPILIAGIIFSVIRWKQRRRENEEISKVQRQSQTWPRRAERLEYPPAVHDRGRGF